MKTALISLIFILPGIYIVNFWYVGSHGHIIFRPTKIEDWILSFLLLICFGMPLLLLIRKYSRKKS